MYLRRDCNGSPTTNEQRASAGRAASALAWISGGRRMTLVLLVYIGGVLSIRSPCILPVIPFVFARGDQPFVRSGLPLLLGMALTFAGVASLAAVAGSWAVDASQYGRYVALAVLALFALTLLSDRLAAFLARPAVAIGERLSGSLGSEMGRSSLATSFVIGIATGFLWAPCAGPILGLVLATVALQGASVGTALLLFAYAAGAATSLAVARLAGGGSGWCCGDRDWSRRRHPVECRDDRHHAAGAKPDLDIRHNGAPQDRGTRRARGRRSPDEPAGRSPWRNPDPGGFQRHDVRRLVQHRAGCSRRPRERRQPAEPRGRDGMDQFGAAIRRIAARQGRARQRLDLCLYQLPPRPALREGLGGQISQRRSCGRRRTYARASLRARHLERAPSRAELRHQLSSRGRHQFSDLEQLRQ